MKVVAICNEKGGAGKTMTATCLVRRLSDLGYKTLLVDVDEQWNATKQYGILKTEGVMTTYDLLTDSHADIREAIQSTSRGDIIPGDKELKDADAAMLKQSVPIAMLADALEPLHSIYDWIVIDCPPSLGLVTKNAFVAADAVVVPVFGDPQSVENLSVVKEEIEMISSTPRLNPKLKIAGLLMTQYDRRKRLCRGLIQDLPSIAKQLNTKPFETRIRQCEPARGACSEHKSPFDKSEARPVVEDYIAFTDELLERMG